MINVNERPILLVEDNADDVELTTLALGEAKITNPVVVLLDIKLPLLSGIDVLRRMREDERTRRTPVVMLTSSKEQVDIAATYDLGANSYVQKPVDFENFVVAARQLGLYWTVLNQPAEGRPAGPTGHR